MFSVQDYLNQIGWNGTTDQFGRNAQQIGQSIQGDGVDGGGFGFDENALGSFFSNLQPSMPSTPPAGNGMTANGTQFSNAQLGTINAPVGNEGTVLTNQPDYGDSTLQNWNSRQRPTYGGGAPGATWDFSQFQSSPGAEAEFTMADNAGDMWQQQSVNQPFYNDQFTQLMNQRDNLQARSSSAAAARAGQASNPQQLDWSWLEGGLPDVELMDSGYASPLAGLNFQQNTAPARGGFNGGGFGQQGGSFMGGGLPF